MHAVRRPAKLASWISIVDNAVMSPTLSRYLGLIALLGSGLCVRGIFVAWNWVDQNGHTEGSPAGLGILVLGAAVALALLALGVVLAILGLLGLFRSKKA